MGMYTEFFFTAEFKRNLDQIDQAALEYLFNGNEKPSVLPNHSFFSKRRSEFMFNCPKYTGECVTVKLGDYFGHVVAHIELKNYEGEIDAFIDYVSPLLNTEKGRCIGWKWYEECDNPTLIFA